MSARPFKPNTPHERLLVDIARNRGLTVELRGPANAVVIRGLGVDISAVTAQAISSAELRPFNGTWRGR